MSSKIERLTIKREGSNGGAQASGDAPKRLRSKYVPEDVFSFSECWNLGRQ